MNVSELIIALQAVKDQSVEVYLGENLEQLVTVSALERYCTSYDPRVQQFTTLIETVIGLNWSEEE